MCWPAETPSGSSPTTCGPGCRSPAWAPVSIRGASPRARALLESARRLPGADEILSAVDAVVRAAAGSGEAHANIDLALAAFTLLAGMPTEAGEVIFAVARTAGWIAHALEEYREPALRLRPRGVYTGPRPAL